MIIRRKIWYLRIYVHMKITMLHISLINFPFAQRDTEFLISLRHRWRACIASFSPSTCTTPSLNRSRVIISDGDPRRLRSKFQHVQHIKGCFLDSITKLHSGYTWVTPGLHSGVCYTPRIIHFSELNRRQFKIPGGLCVSVRSELCMSAVALGPANLRKHDKTLEHEISLENEIPVTLAESLDPSMAWCVVFASELHRASQEASWSTVKVLSIHQHHCCIWQTIAALKFVLYSKTDDKKIHLHDRKSVSAFFPVLQYHKATFTSSSLNHSLTRPENLRHRGGTATALQGQGGARPGRDIQVIFVYLAPASEFSPSWTKKRKKLNDCLFKMQSKSDTELESSWCHLDSWYPRILYVNIRYRSKDIPYHTRYRMNISYRISYVYDILCWHYDIVCPTHDIVEPLITI